MEARLGRTAKRIRQAHHLELLDIAQTAGVSEATISRFEAGAGWRRETDAIVTAYAEACDTTPQRIWQAALNLDDEELEGA